MAVIRIPERAWFEVRTHLSSGPGEHFAFFLAQPCATASEPTFLVKDAICIPDEYAGLGEDGWSLTPEGYLLAINAAVNAKLSLIEAHNHGGCKPRFSSTDRQGLKEFVPYVLESLPDRPYAATVWGDSTIHGEFFLPDGSTGSVRSITAVGERFRQLTSRDDDDRPVSARFSRQLPWFTESGQQLLGRVRVAIVGVGGTGAHIAQQVTYLGIRDFVIVEDDAADETSMNRLVTATAADLDTPKGILARRLIKSAAPSAQVALVAGRLQTPAAIDALKRVDIIFGCVDNDGARLILNEISRAFNVPYFDVAVGLEVAANGVDLAGGRLAVITPGGPCLHCAGEIDKQEAQFFLSTRREQVFQLARGYVRGMDVPAPSVVSLNASVASLAVNEFATFFSGLRPVSFFTDLDLLGSGRPTKSQWLTPRRVTADPGCVVCSVAGLGDRADVDRYGRRMPEVVDVVSEQR